MPIFNKRVKKDDISMETANTPEMNLDDIQINDFSDDVDLNGLGDLLGSGIPASGYNTPSVQTPTKPESPKISDALGTLFGAIGDKFKSKKKRGDIPDLPGADSSKDPNYISETVSFADSEQELEGWCADNSTSPQSQPNDMMNFGGFNSYGAVQPAFNSANNVGTQQPGQFGQMPPEMPMTYDVYSQPTQEFPQEPPQNFQQEMPQSTAPSRFDDGLNSAGGANPEIFAPQWPDFDDYSLPQTFAPENYDNFAAPQESAPQQNIDEEEPPVRRSHDIMGAVRARIEQFRRRLPSFKPKVYEVPEVSYNEKEDKLAKSPSLMADVERYINSQNDLREVSQEYDQMRQYIQSVNTDVRLRRSDIAPPENIHEVYSAQNELFDMINSIGMQNEEQRRRIGVYAPREEEDPYNYRGINDVRQNYTDMESASFSMSHGIDFESEEKISPDRSLYIQQYDSPQQEEPQMDDDFGFGDMPGTGMNHQSGFFSHDSGNNYADTSGNNFGMDNYFDNDFDDEFDNDFDDDKF